MMADFDISKLSQLDKERFNAYKSNLDFYGGSQWAKAGKVGYEHTVDWRLLEMSVLLLSRYGDEGRRVTADPELIIQGARHLAGHYHKAGRPIPNALCVLI